MSRSVQASHAGGIQPPLSFFRPSRPSQSGIQLSSLQRRPSHSSLQRRPSHSSLASTDEPSPHKHHTSFDRTTTDIGKRPPLVHSPSPSRSTTARHDHFNPTPPASHPPLAHVPIPDPKSPSHAPMLNYRLHPSRNSFFLNGTIITGGDSPWAFIACIAVTIGISGLWFGTTCVWYWHNRHGTQSIPLIGAYLLLVVLSTMFTTAFSDPGILPRNLDPDPPYPTTTQSDDAVPVPLPRDLKVRNDVVRVKYCQTCKTYRPPRSSHCKMCDNCVDSCDHHCQWINNCVGRRNYSSFIALLFFATLTLVYVIVTSAVQLYLQAHSSNFRHALSTSHGVGSAVVFLLSICVIWPVTALFVYHIRLILLNVTTIEQIRNNAHKSIVPGEIPNNPFSHGSWWRNLVSVLCRPRGYSWLDARGVATEDQREANPGHNSKQG